MKKLLALSLVATAVAFSPALVANAHDHEAKVPDCAAMEHDHHDHDHDHDHDNMKKDGKEMHDHDHDHDAKAGHDHDHDHAMMDKKCVNTEVVEAGAAKYAYTANFKLMKGVYAITAGHTHEHTFAFGFAKLDKDVVAVKVGNEIFEAKDETKLRNGASVTIKPGMRYNLQLAHHESQVFLTVPEDGTYMLFTETAPGTALPWTLKNAKAEEVKPVYQRVVSKLKDEINAGYFPDNLIKDRELSDWEGDWQSVYPYLVDGSLDPVWEMKAKSGTMTAEEYKKYYTTGYKTDVNRIVIKGDKVTFYYPDGPRVGTYKYEGHTVLNYPKGNRGVRYEFVNTDKESKAPKFFQFSDHNIYPTKAFHFHLFWGDESQEKLHNELDNWPTYYPSNLSKKELLQEMLEHK